MSRSGSNQVSTRYVDIVRIEQAAGTQFRHDFGKGGACDSEATFAAAEHPEMTDHFIADIPGAMHNDPSGEGIVIAGVQSLEPDRVAMGSDIGGTGPIGSCRAGVRAWLVGETLHPPGPQGVGASTMCDQVRVNAAASELHQVEPRRTRGEGEIRNADEIPVRNTVAVTLERVERAPKQARGNQAAAVARSHGVGPSDRRGRSQTGQTETKELTTGKRQGVRFRLR